MRVGCHAGRHTAAVATGFKSEGDRSQGEDLSVPNLEAMANQSRTIVYLFVCISWRPFVCGVGIIFCALKILIAYRGFGKIYFWQKGQKGQRGRDIDSSNSSYPAHVNLYLLFLDSLRLLLRYWTTDNPTIRYSGGLPVPSVKMADMMEDTATTHFNGAVPIKRARTELMAPDSDTQVRRRKEAERTYGRGRKIPVKSVRDKKLRGNLKALEGKYKEASMRAKDAEILLENTGGFLEPETELERTYKTSQDEIKKSVPIATAQMGFELKLDGGSYVAEYTRNGRELLLAGRKGHVATMEWRVSLGNGISTCPTLS